MPFLFVLSLRFLPAYILFSFSHLSVSLISPLYLSSIHFLLGRLVVFEAGALICLWPHIEEGRNGEREVALTHSPSLLISLKWLSEQTAVTKVTMSPLCVFASLHPESGTLFAYNMCLPPSMKRRGVLIVRRGTCLVSDSPRRPVMTCLPHNELFYASW